jgi:hypothetical protein
MSSVSSGMAVTMTRNRARPIRPRIIPAKSRCTPGVAFAQHGHERRATEQEDHHQQMPRICLGRLPEERLCNRVLRSIGSCGAVPPGAMMPEGACRVLAAEHREA